MIDYNEIDFEELRNDLINYFGSATAYSEMAYMDVINIENASNDELLIIARKNGFNILDYIKSQEDINKKSRIY